MTDITMPKLSDSMEQGLVLQWLVADGAEVHVGDELVEIETDKATMTYQSEVEGTLLIAVAEGATVAVGEVIAHVGVGVAGDEPADDGEEPIVAGTEQPADDGEAPIVARTEQPVAEPVTRNGNGAAPMQRRSDTPATPVARRLAAVHGVALGSLSGTGPRGRITKADVLGAAGVVEAPAPPHPPAPAPRSVAAAPAAPVSSAPITRTEELTRLQQVIARRMAEAKATIPHFQVQTEVAIDAALELRGELKAAAADGFAVPSVNDLIVKASALALRQHPYANGSYKDGHFELHDRVNVGVAVAADGALVVPTVFDADAKSLSAIAADTRALAARVRDGQITPPELSGATFTVSNLGMFGMTAITPVINPPQAAILGVGAARPTLARDPETGEIVDRALLTLTLSCDHRILYGADAARFLADIKTALEAPLRLAFG
jgi:pyruvate dehydrogenase E2 component (dihydrolipoamide acetyltransferase)